MTGIGSGMLRRTRPGASGVGNRADGQAIIGDDSIAGLGHKRRRFGIRSALHFAVRGDAAIRSREGSPLSKALKSWAV